MANTIIYGDLIVENFEKMLLLNIEIRSEINEHAHMKIVGVIDSSDSEEYLSDINLNTEICLKYKSGKSPDERNNNVFCGIINDVEISVVQDVCHIIISVISATKNLEIEKHSQSIQNINTTYNDILYDLLKKYPKGGILDKVSKLESIGKIINGKLNKTPIIQYKETDWDFLKRLASHYNTGLIPDILSKGTHLYFGLTRFEKGEVKATNYKIKKDFDKFKKANLEIPSVLQIYFTYYEIETDFIYQIGDKVKFNNHDLIVTKTFFKYDDSVIKNIIKLEFEQAVFFPYIPNDNISGGSIFGTVIATSRDNVKVHLNFDEKQNIGDAYWYPFASTYASSKETGFYCMPEVGDFIRLYHSENEESSGMAMSSIKMHDTTEDIANVPKDHPMADTNVKYLRTAFGKEVKFRPNGIDIIAKDNNVFMTLNDDGTINLKSSDKISFTAINDINLNAKNINFEATENIKIVSKGSSINLADDITIEGEEVKIN